MGVQHRRFARALTIGSGAALAIGMGLACFWLPFSRPLTRASYDFPFLSRPILDTHEIVLVYLDEQSAKELNQPIDDAWNRSLHTALLERLTAEGARLALYDLVFDTPSSDPAEDESFANAIQTFGHVVIGAALDFGVRQDSKRTFDFAQKRVIPPLKVLRKSAAGWGLLVFQPIDPDYGVRELFVGTSDFPTATWKAAELLGAESAKTTRDPTVERWINYYGPRDTFSSINFAQALSPDGIPAGFFKDKIVLIGGRSTIAYLTKAQDEFRTPYSRKFGLDFLKGSLFEERETYPFTSGLEVHATVLLNLLHGDWLTRLSTKWEIGLIVLVGLLAGALAFLRPVFAVAVAAILAAAITYTAYTMAWHQHIWFDWVVPAAIQVPFGLAWSVGSQYLLENRRRQELRRAFGFYLSPQMADRIADSDFDLAPGGKVVEVSVVFTDLEGFTTMSENLDPSEVSEILTSYFGLTTKCILENNGTIIKYIGDAVFAAWGAPVDEPNHAVRAAEAACDLRSLSEMEVSGKTLRTRVGIHTGKVLAGNLGSTYRFDYTMIGDAVNFAARLESLNKYLKTQVLISDAVRQHLADKFVTRFLGEFRVAGKKQSVLIHELLCRRDSESGEKAWIESFEKGLTVFREGNFSGARDFMATTKEMRGGFDGPSEFYLKKIATLETNGELENWTGVVELSEK